MIVVFGFNEKELPRKRRADRLAAEAELRESDNNRRKESVAPERLYDNKRSPRERRVLAPAWTPKQTEDGGGGGGYALGACPRRGDEYGQSSGGLGASHDTYPRGGDEYGQSSRGAEGGV